MLDRWSLFCDNSTGSAIAYGMAGYCDTNCVTTNTKTRRVRDISVPEFFRLRSNEMTPQDARTRHWDVIVIGAGMGGGMAARRLAEQGLSVLVVEKGPRGYTQEQQELDEMMSDPHARRIRGYWPKPVQATVNQRQMRFFAPIGCGVGGTSAFYAGTLERPERHDLEDTAEIPHPTGGWPVGYDAFTPYFEQAEALLHISGTHDPLSREAPSDLGPPPEISAGETAMITEMRADGLHPYRQHLAFRNLPGCLVCLGHKCPRKCKMDGRSAGLEPALETGNAVLLENCDVTEINYDTRSVTGLTVVHAGVTHTLNAGYYVLAAGALGSPRLLLMSDRTNPKGCANSSDWVGRGLMFHLNEVFALWPKRHQRFEGATKAVSLRDIYTLDGARMGMIQSLGLEVSFNNIAAYLARLYDRSVLGRIPKLRYLTNIPALVAAKVLGKAKVFVGILEDLPYPENRVLVDADDKEVPSFVYSLPAELLHRRQIFRRQIKKTFKGYRTMLMGQRPELNYGHPCGTLRFGSDPETSVLDANCKTHDLDNLYVADSSFFPTSMGVNPSLTIAANALRVGDVITSRLKTR